MNSKRYGTQLIAMSLGITIPQKGQCSGEQDLKDARNVCESLSIPFSEVNFSKEYWSLVFERILRDYQAGVTPNPDVLCNREIKFKTFFRYALERFGADYVATGHYAQVS